MPQYGFDKLLEQLISQVEADFQWRSQENVGDSEIERLLFISLKAFCAYTYGGMWKVLLSRTSENTKRLLEDTDEDWCFTLIVQPQAEFDGRRADFAIFAYHWGPDDPAIGGSWKPLIIECDGHNYHERTKEQAARDRAKDRNATLRKIETFRFTGSEIWRNPWECAEQIVTWAERVRYD